MIIQDPYFRVEILSKTERPNLLSYLAMHQDYSEGNVYDEYLDLVQLSEKELGERLIRNCIKFSHWGILEHPTITFNIIGFPHSVMVQARTHRVGISFDCQSQRYTSKRILTLAELLNDDRSQTDKAKAIEEVFYLRPVDYYLDRNGNKYHYSLAERNNDMNELVGNIFKFYRRVKEKGYAPEHARDLLFQNIRQNFVVTFNARSLLHFCDLRIPADAQLEIRTLAKIIFDEFCDWMPEVAEHYRKTRFGKNKLSP